MIDNVRLPSLASRGRDWFQRAFDSYCGACIVGLYFLYLGVVKGALSM
jgi:hypothetical protein